MALADNLSAVAYRQTLNRRSVLIEAFANDLQDDLLLLPTTANLPPKLTDLEDDDVFNRENILALRNTSLANVADACSIALPFESGGLTLSAMLVARGGCDQHLLSCAKTVERALARL